MILRHFLATVGSVGLVVAATAAQSRPQTTAAPHADSADVRQTQTAPASQATADVEEMTLAGCLMRHRDVPVPTNAPSAAAVKHDGFLLVDAMIVPHHQGGSAMRANTPPAAAHDHTAEPRPVVDPTPNVGDSQMFKVEGLPDAELEPFAGTRVTLMGALIAGDPAARRSAGAVDTDHDASPFKATMIHPTSNPCRQ